MIVNQRVLSGTVIMVMVMVMVMVGPAVIMSAMDAAQTVTSAGNVRVHATHRRENQAHAQHEAQHLDQARHGVAEVYANRPSVANYGHISPGRLRAPPSSCGWPSSRFLYI